MPLEVKCKYDELVEIESLKYHPENRNKHPKDQIERLSKLLKYQGWRHPVIVSSLSKYIVAGHGRLESAKLLGEETVPVVFQEFDNKDQEYAFLTSDNAIASWSELDFAAINADIASGKVGPFNVDLLGIDGFVVDMGEKDTVAVSPPDPGEPDIEHDTGRFFLIYPKKSYLEVVKMAKPLMLHHGVEDMSELTYRLIEKAYGDLKNDDS